MANLTHYQTIEEMAQAFADMMNEGEGVECNKWNAEDAIKCEVKRCPFGNPRLGIKLGNPYISDFGIVG